MIFFQLLNAAGNGKLGNRQSTYEGKMTMRAKHGNKWLAQLMQLFGDHIQSLQVLLTNIIMHKKTLV